jgi:hypothetical protein
MLAPLDFRDSFAKAMASPWTTSFGPSGQAAFAVYRNGWLSACLDTLAANYPTVLALLGSELFKAVALDCARAHPPRSPVLALYGKEFASFLAHTAVAEEHPYLPDVAGLERLWTECYFAADQPALGGGNGPLVLPHPVELHSSVRLGYFATPAVTIWEAHQSAQDFEELEPAWQPERALLVRKDLKVLVHLVDGQTFQFLGDLQRGGSLIDAAGHLLADPAQPDLRSVTAWLLDIGALVAPNRTTLGRN